MITRIVRMQLQEGKSSDFLKIFYEANKKIASFEGCISVELFRDFSDPDTVITLSTWEDLAYLDAYRDSELFISTWRRVKPLFRAPAHAFSMEKV